MLLKRKPPLTVILVCAFEVIGLILLPSTFFKETTRAFGMWYQVYLVLTGIFSASIIWFLWKMKRIGIYIYFASYAVHNLVAIIVGNWLPGVVIIPVIGALLLLPHFKKMNKGFGGAFARFIASGKPGAKIISKLNLFNEHK